MFGRPLDQSEGKTVLDNILEGTLGAMSRKTVNNEGYVREDVPNNVFGRGGCLGGC